MEFVFVQSIDLLLDQCVQMLVSVFWYQTRTENAKVTVRRLRLVIAENLLHGWINEKEGVEPEMAQLFLGKDERCGDVVTAAACSDLLICLVSFG
jgi:hypothetical protein